MSRSVIVQYVLLLAVTAACSAGAVQPTGTHPAPEAPTQVENFRLIDHQGVSREFYHLEDAKGVILFAFDAESPVAMETAATLQQHAEEAKEAGVSIWGLNVRPGADREAVAKAAADNGLGMPVLMDPSQRIAFSLGLTHAGETLLVDPAKSWAIVYRGAVDNRFAEEAASEQATETYLRNAAVSMLDGQPIVLASTQPAGETIAYADTSSVSYANDIVPILESKCITCHYEGGLGPFPMNSYKKVRGWAPMMRETVRTGRMPPWHADDATGPYQHDRSLTVDEERKLLAWIEQGAVKDTDEDPLAKYDEPKPATWQLGEPDAVVQLPEVQQIQADGIVEYRYIPVSSGLKENRWLKGVEVRTNNPAVVHHALIFVSYPRDYRHLEPEARSGLNGYFGAYLPGAQLNFFPEGSAMFLPHDAVFVFQMHYNSTGKPEEDMTEMGLYFADGPPEDVIKIEAAHYNDFLIPPNEYDVEAFADYRFDEKATILGLSPHMHYRGSRFKFAANFPEDSGMQDRLLLNVPLFEFDWQPMYFLEQPVQVPKGTVMECEGAFNNSRFNPKNPNPDAYVRFGEQSFEEMFIGYVMFTTPYREENFQPQEIDTSKIVGYGEAITKDSLPGMSFVMMRRIKVDFQADGVLSAGDGAIKGTWEMNGNTITLDTPLGKHDIFVNNDELIFHGRAMRRVQ
ncbi:MAG: redoxin domain-containing protein [Candidatus Hydrogenedens sp.]|nr:redoxin domain-containing protein [Candidatus Hydrogenedens sp.]